MIPLLVGVIAIALYVGARVYIRARAVRRGRVDQRGGALPLATWQRLASLSVGASVVTGVGAAIALVLTFRGDEARSIAVSFGTPCIVATLALVQLARHFERRGKRQKLAEAAGRPLPDGVPIVLYLRGFAAEGRLPRGSGSAVEFTEGREELLLDPLNQRASVVGLANARQPTPLGHIPLRADDQSWKPIVESFVDRAELVVVLVERGTAGLAWEIETLASRGQLAKTAFVIPPRVNRTTGRDDPAALRLDVAFLRTCLCKDGRTWPSATGARIEALLVEESSKLASRAFGVQIELDADLGVRALRAFGDRTEELESVGRDLAQRVSPEAAAVSA
jgi:hypothetical protein